MGCYSHILLRCDSSGDLYPVTKPSTLPTDFASTSSFTWHQRLGYPGDEVLRSLALRHLISCNKEKSTHACHACQLVLMHQIIDSLHKEFDMTNLEALKDFLGISATRHSTCLFLSQKKEPHFASLKRILRYVTGTMDFGLHLYASATTSLVGYTDAADWGGYPFTRIYFRAEAEYQGVANVVAEIAWIHNLLYEIHSLILNATFVYCDNVSAIYMSANPLQHQRMKHIEMNIHLVCDMVTIGQLEFFMYLLDFSMRGLMSDPQRQMIDLSIRSNLHEGLSDGDLEDEESNNREKRIGR
nr:hypothetical protein [Tanacetum cinerariifolium]